MPIFGSKESRQEKKAKRQAKRSSRKSAKSCNPSNTSGSLFDDGLSGSCEAGNLKAEKTKVVKAKPFNANRSSGLLNTVGSKRQRERAERKAELNRLKEETGKTLVGRTLSKVFGKKPKPRQQKHANTRFL